jgi:hypothetical protein
MLPALILFVLVTALAVVPSAWVAGVIRRHAAERPDAFPLTGAACAASLLARHGLVGVTVEETREGDHYDPDAKAVRLSVPHFHGRSLAATAIAAHEVGHAMQDAERYPPLMLRIRIARHAYRIVQFGAVIWILAPIVLTLTGAPALAGAQVAAGIVLFAIALAMHAVTLPVEFDASFARALPMLRDGGLVAERDLPDARRILRAAALTYVAAAIASVLNILRWWRFGRF